MAASDWFRPPRSVLALYLAGAVTAMACLTWLTIRQLNSDELAEAQRTRQRLAAVADRVLVRVQQGLTDLERVLSSGGSDFPDQAVIVSGDEGAVTIERGTLPFVPVAARPPVVLSDAFMAAQSAEDAGDPGRAADAYRQVLTTPVREERARAHVGLGRVLRKAGHRTEALAAYVELSQMHDVVIEGRPADLIGRLGICRTLKEEGQEARLAQETAALRADLVRGRWPITGAVWHAAYADTSGGTGPDQATTDAMNAKLAAAEALQASWPLTEPGPQLVRSEAGTALVLSIRDESRVRAVVIGAAWVERLWQQIGTDANVDVALLERDGQPILGRTSLAPVSLATAETGLPWTIAVSDAQPERGLREARSRRRLFLLGLSVVGLLIVGSGYFTFRGIRRELAIARMHADFVSAASHEFRTPLTSIRQLSHMLQEGRVESDERRGQYYSVIVRESERLHRLVERLLSFGRADAGRLHTESLDARELGSSVAADFQRRLSDRAIDLALADGPCRVRADREMLSLALWNLLDNAAKYSPLGHRVQLEVSTGGGRVRLAVRDQGAGIPPEDRRRIFEQFVRGSDAAASSAPGSGLGLALVDRVVRAHGGDVQIDSEVGRGTVFTISLPMETTA